MKRDDLDALVADVLGAHFTRLRADLEAHITRAIAAKPVPPFVAPQPWTAGAYGAGNVVRHRNGLFSARRDTEGEPGFDDGWLPLLVGIAGLDLDWTDERTLVIRMGLSDGEVVELVRHFDVPVVRGPWEPGTIYRPGDRVFRFGEWQALKASTGVDPSANDEDGVWLKVGGKQARGVSFSIDNDGTLFEGGRPIGSLKPMVADLFQQLTNGGGNHG